MQVRATGKSAATTCSSIDLVDYEVMDSGSTVDRRNTCTAPRMEMIVRGQSNSMLIS